MEKIESKVLDKINEALNSESLKTDEDTGNIQIWNEQVQLDRDVGTVDPHSGAITFNESFIRGASAKEKEVLGIEIYGINKNKKKE